MSKRVRIFIIIVIIITGTLFSFLVIVKKLSDSDYAISMYNFFMK